MTDEPTISHTLDDGMFPHSHRVRVAVSGSVEMAVTEEEFDALRNLDSIVDAVITAQIKLVGRTSDTHGQIAVTRLSVQTIDIDL